MSAMEVHAFYQDGLNTTSGRIITQLFYTAVDVLGQPTNMDIVVELDTVQNLTATPFPIFTSELAALNYYKDAQATLLMATVNAQFGGTLYTTYNVDIVDPQVGAAVAMIQADIAALQAAVTTLTAANVRTTSSLSPSLVGTGATGSQVSASKPSTVRLWLSESVTSSIGGAAVSAISIKICATNNATEAAWTTLGVFEEDQTVTLALALQSVQVMKGMIEFDLPAGWYWKAESSGSGTHSESILGGQQTIYG